MLSIRSSSRGFTLIELLVVIGIIGILAGVAIGAFGGVSESAKGAKCMSNLRALAVAAHNYAMTDSDGYLPCAGSYEYRSKNKITEHKAWISWVHDKDTYSKKGGKYPTAHLSSPSWTTYATYAVGNKSAHDKALFALTNGVIWAHCGHNASAYVCPKHLEACQKKKLIPVWSYVMNSFFGFDRTQGSSISAWDRVAETSIHSKHKSVPLGADKVLLFAELPFTQIDRKYGDIQNQVQLEGETAAFDCVLQYDMKHASGWSGTPESMGFNHRSGKQYFAHVAFADGHVAKFMLPKNYSASEVRNLTTWLCQGDDVSFSGSRYDRVQADEKSN